MSVYRTARAPRFATRLGALPTPPAATGVVRYIRAGATGVGNGGSWADAYPTFASVTWRRGYTYYVAGGEYNENVIVYGGGVATDWILVKKANAADNSASAGWDPAYASTQAVINGTLALWSARTEVDGITGSGTSGHGIKVHRTALGSGSVLSPAGSLGPFKISHVEVKGPGYGLPYAIDAISYNNAYTLQKSLEIKSCWLHDVPRNGLTLGGCVGTSYADFGFLVDGCVISETGGSPDPAIHGQGIQIGFGADDAFGIIRNTHFRNCTGTAMIAFLGDSTTPPAPAIHRDMRIYNCTFSITDPVLYPLVSPGPIYASEDATECYNIAIFNNTFYAIVGHPYTNGRIQLQTPGAHDNVLQNCVWEGCRLPANHAGVTESHNAYFGNTGGFPNPATTQQVNGTASTFTNAAAGDFSLAPGGYAIGNGADLSAIFTTDIEGRPRGSTWDRGAYQHA